MINKKTLLIFFLPVFLACAGPAARDKPKMIQLVDLKTKVGLPDKSFSEQILVLNLFVEGHCTAYYDLFTQSLVRGGTNEIPGDSQVLLHLKIVNPKVKEYSVEINLKKYGPFNAVENYLTAQLPEPEREDTKVELFFVSQEKKEFLGEYIYRSK